MIEKINYARLTNNELYTLIKTILSILTGVDQEALNLKGWLDKLLIPFKKLELSVGMDRGSQFTVLIAQDDDFRDKCFKAFKTYVEACLLRDNDDWNAAGELLWRIINNHGLYLHTESYSKESALLDKLILELEMNAKAREAIVLIKGEEWFTEMKNGRDRYKSHWDERREEQANKPASESEQARKDIRIRSQNLFQFIDLMFVSEGGETWLTLIHQINGEIIKSNTIVKARTTRRENSKEEIVEKQQQSL